MGLMKVTMISMPTPTVSPGVMATDALKVCTGVSVRKVPVATARLPSELTAVAVTRYVCAGASAHAVCQPLAPLVNSPATLSPAAPVTDTSDSTPRRAVTLTPRPGTRGPSGGRGNADVAAHRLGLDHLLAALRRAREAQVASRDRDLRQRVNDRGLRRRCSALARCDEQQAGYGGCGR